MREKTIGMSVKKVENGYVVNLIGPNMPMIKHEENQAFYICKTEEEVHRLASKYFSNLTSLND